jgi:protein TonB
VLENQFLRTFCTVSASAVLVFGGLILLTSTAPWHPAPPIEIEASTPDASAGAMPDSDVRVAEAAAASDQADIAPTPEIESAAPEPDETARSFAPASEKQPDDVRGATDTDANTPSPEETAELEATGMPVDQDAADVAPESVAQSTPAVIDAVAPEQTKDDVAPEIAETGSVAQASVNAASDAPAPAAPVAPEPLAAVVAEAKADAATTESAEALATLPPRAIASAKANQATDQIAGVLAALPPAPPAPPAPAASEKMEAATAEVADVLVATRPAPQVVTPEVVVAMTPPPPLPKRKPETPAEPKEAALPAPRENRPLEPAEPKRELAAKEENAREAAPRAKSQWQPMTLAPADKPATSLTKVPLARPSGQAYAAKVWSQLARHKPRAGQRGSASVSFAIGQNGGLQAVRIARSSGNARVDQLALSTVRNAAPFAPPPSGAASYTIRIDFQ